MLFGHLSFKLYSLVQSLHFSTHASSKQNSQRQNMVNFYSIKRFFLLFSNIYIYVDFFGRRINVSKHTNFV